MSSILKNPEYAIPYRSLLQIALYCELILFLYHSSSSSKNAINEPLAIFNPVFLAALAPLFFDDVLRLFLNHHTMQPIYQ